MDPNSQVRVPTFGEVVATHAAQRPAAVAMRFAGREWTYAALDAHAGRIAAALVRQGLGPGDRVAFVGQNSDALALLALGVACAGMIFVPINWRLAPREVEHILADSGAALLVSGPGYDLGALDRAALPSIVDAEPAATGNGWMAGQTGSLLPSVASGDTVLLIYTSGTTGLPKGVMLSHRSLFGTSVLRRAAAVEWDDWSSDDVTLVPIPLAHIAGFGMLARTLFFGGEVVIQPTFSPADTLHAIAEQRITKLGLVPTAIKMMIDHPGARKVDYSRIRTMVYGAAPISIELLREAIDVFDCEFAQSYGMSETSGTCVALPPEDHHVDGTVRMMAAGRPLPGTELRILNADGHDLSAGEVGEIAVRCISMMTGYWNNPEATAAVLDEDGWYRTGDAGLLDADGYLFIKDRVTDMIVSGAENIYSAEVENALAAHPAVADVAVIGVPDPHWGEAVKAIVVTREGQSPDAVELIAWARQRIAGYKVPRSIDFVAALPLNASGKVQKAELRRPYWADAERKVG